VMITFRKSNKNLLEC